MCKQESLKLTALRTWITFCWFKWVSFLPFGALNRLFSGAFAVYILGRLSKPFGVNKPHGKPTIRGPITPFHPTKSIPLMVELYGKCRVDPRKTNGWIPKMMGLGKGIFPLTSLTSGNFLGMNSLGFWGVPTYHTRPMGCVMGHGPPRFVRKNLSQPALGLPRLPCETPLGALHGYDASPWR